MFCRYKVFGGHQTEQELSPFVASMEMGPGRDLELSVGIRPRSSSNPRT